MFGRFFGGSRQDAGKKAPIMQAEVHAPEPPTDPASTPEPFVVSPNTAKEIMSELPDRSAEVAASIVNDLAFNDVSKPSPKPAKTNKRKRQEEDKVDGSPKKRVAKETGVNGTRDEPSVGSTKGVTEHGGRSNRASLERVKLGPGKLPRPKKELRTRHMAGSYSAVQKNGDIFDPAPSPKKQVEKPAPPPTTTRRNPSSPEATPRRRGRPPRVGPSPSKKKKSVKKGQQIITQDPKVKTRRKGRPEEKMSLEKGSRDVYEAATEKLPQKAGPKARSKPSSTIPRDDQNKGAAASKPRRSTAAANGYRDAIMNENTDLTKTPERDARRAAKRRKTLEQAPTSTPPVFEGSPEPQNQVDSEEYVEEEEGEEDEPEREGRRGPQDAMDKNGPTSSQVDEVDGEDGEDTEGAEDAENVSDHYDPNEVIHTDHEDDEKGEDLEVFGEDRAWKTVLEGAHSICGPNLPLNRMPKLLTLTIKALLYEVRDARNLYEQIRPCRDTNHDPVNGLNGQLKKSLDAIEDQIKTLSEKASVTKGSEVIRDIYARAIPAMVFLLKSALRSRKYHSDEPCDLETLNEIVEGLGEIIRLQNMAILLCEKATHWKAKPVPTSRPIVRPTTWKMFPYLKEMRKAFSKVLLEQNRKRNMKQNAVDYAKRREELAQSAQHAKLEAARKNEILYKRVQESREQEDERRRSAKRTFKQFKEDDLRARQSQQINGRAEPNTPWSTAEDRALYYQLENGYAGSLTSTFMTSHLCVIAVR